MCNKEINGRNTIDTLDKLSGNTSFKEEIDHVPEENKNKTDIVKILPRQINAKTIKTEFKEQETDTNQIP